MRILHVDAGREMRGGQWQALRLHQYLVGAGHESMLVARQGSPLLELTAGCRLPCEALHPLGLRSLARRFELVHVHDAHSHMLGAVLVQAPLIVSRRVAFPPGTSIASRLKYRRARRFLAVSRYVGGKLVEAGVDPDRIDVVYDGMETPSSPASGDDFVTPYTLDPAKGMALAQRAADLAGVSLVCSKDLERDLSHASAMIYLTHSEGLGSGILLAMAYGVAVIASRTGGIPELIDDGVTGLLVQNEPKAVADAMRGLVPERRAALGQAARASVLNRFTVAHMAAATLNAYQKALNE
jgi:hypothetical protein